MIQIGLICAAESAGGGRQARLFEASSGAQQGGQGHEKKNQHRRSRARGRGQDELDGTASVLRRCAPIGRGSRPRHRADRYAGGRKDARHLGQNGGRRARDGDGRRQSDRHARSRRFHQRGGAGAFGARLRGARHLRRRRRAGADRGFARRRAALEAAVRGVCQQARPRGQRFRGGLRGAFRSACGPHAARREPSRA